MRIYKKLPCGCLVSEDGGGALIPCYYPEVGQKETELHKKSIKDYFKELREKKSIFEKLKNYEPCQVVCYVKILGEKVPLSKNDILRIFGCKVE